MKYKNTYNPQTVTHPSEILAEALEEKNMGAKEFAVRTGKPEKTISALLSGNSAITPDMAVQFEKVLQVPARFWLEAQRRFDEYEAREKYEEEIVENSIEWAKQFPYAKMAELGWVKKTKKIHEKVQALFSFFGMASKNAWHDYYFEQKLKLAFRASLKDNEQAPALTAWLRHGQIQADALEVAAYSKKRLLENLVLIKALVKEQPEDYFSKLQRICAEAGVAVIFSPCLPNVPIHGAARWHGEKPVVQLTGRYKRNDIFWFTFFHEIGHILLHGKKYFSLENIEYNGINKNYEAEADSFAAEMLFSKEAEKELLKYKKIDAELILNFSQKQETHPAIIVGRLQYEKILGYNELRHFFVPIQLESN